MYRCVPRLQWPRIVRKAEHFLAITAIACTLICFRRLAN
jgi:hypothetical protein